MLLNAIVFLWFPSLRQTHMLAPENCAVCGRLKGARQWVAASACQAFSCPHRFVQTGFQTRIYRNQLPTVGISGYAMFDIWTNPCFCSFIIDCGPFWTHVPCMFQAQRLRFSLAPRIHAKWVNSVENHWKSLLVDDYWGFCYPIHRGSSYSIVGIPIKTNQ